MYIDKCNFNKLYYLKIFLLFNYFFNYYTIYKYIEYNNPTNIPEFLYNTNQTLQLIISSESCPSTLFFDPIYHEYKNSNIISKINIKDKNYFVSFFECGSFYAQLIDILEKNGLIKSNYIFGKNNLFICSKINKFLPKKVDNHFDLDKYQKVYRYLNMEYLVQKNTLFKHYSSMKKIFYNDFHYMPETYNYPEEKNIINKKFKNYKLNLSDLWLIKPNNGSGGKGIFILTYLKNINYKQFVITK